MIGRDKDETFSDVETARRRDEVVRRIANTPRQHRVKTSVRQSKKKKPTAQVS
jgi:hypothetical protein